MLVVVVLVIVLVLVLVVKCNTGNREMIFLGILEQKYI